MLLSCTPEAIGNCNQLPAVGRTCMGTLAWKNSLRSSSTSSLRWSTSAGMNLHQCDAEKSWVRTHKVGLQGVEGWVWVEAPLLAHDLMCPHRQRCSCAQQQPPAACWGEVFLTCAAECPPCPNLNGLCCMQARYSPQGAVFWGSLRGACAGCRQLTSDRGRHPAASAPTPSRPAAAAPAPRPRTDPAHHASTHATHAVAAHDHALGSNTSGTLRCVRKPCWWDAAAMPCARVQLVAWPTARCTLTQGATPYSSAHLRLLRQRADVVLQGCCQAVKQPVYATRRHSVPVGQQSVRR